MARHQGPANARTVPITEFAVDRRGWGMFARLAGVHQRGIDGTAGTRVLDPETASAGGRYTGSTSAVVQRFLGVAPLGLARPVAPTTSTLPEERAAGLADLPLRIFAERLARGR